MTFSLVDTDDPTYTASGFRPLRRSASRAVCSHSGATNPYTLPLCSAHSPTANTSETGTSPAQHARSSPTTMPRLTFRPASAASVALGRMPAAITTRSQARRLPSANSRPSTCPFPRMPVVRVARCVERPICSNWRRSTSAAPGSSCASIKCGIKWITCVSRPQFRRPRAASNPSSPPPITAAVRAVAAERMMRSQSSSVRNTNTPCLNVPCSSRTLARGGMTGLLPVAIISLSYVLREPVSGDDLLRAHIDPLDPLACMERDVPGRVPGHRVDEDVIGFVAARQHAREKNAVVVAARLVAEHHDVEAASAPARRRDRPRTARPPCRCR